MVFALSHSLVLVLFAFSSLSMVVGLPAPLNGSTGSLVARNSKAINQGKTVDGKAIRACAHLDSQRLHRRNQPEVPPPIGTSEVVELEKGKKIEFHSGGQAPHVFQVGKLIGYGRSGYVYALVLPGHDFVVKKIVFQDQADYHAADYEARLLHMLGQLQGYGVNRDKKAAWIIMSKVPGDHFKKTERWTSVKNKRKDCELYVGQARQATFLSAFQDSTDLELRSGHLMHGDIKLRNIMITNQGQGVSARMVDYGCVAWIPKAVPRVPQLTKDPQYFSKLGLTHVNLHDPRSVAIAQEVIEAFHDLCENPNDDSDEEQ